jgi:putative ABC transport system ATP-binding protein
MALIRLENVSRVYNTNGIELPALKKISFLVEKGEFLSIAGPSGSGKTTLLNIMGFLDLPSSGDVFLEDKQIRFKQRNKMAELRRNTIGFIFQTFNLIPVLTAFENVEFPLLLKTGIKTKERRQSVENMLRNVGLEDLMQRKPSEMSGGQQQRVAIARALVKQPHIVLADEPTANLDSKTGGEILQLMRDLNRKTDASFIFSTHDQMVMDFAQRLIRLKDGQIESDEKRG